jgi:thymidine kinase
VVKPEAGPGEILVYYGPMFSGKTEGMIDAMVRAQIGKQKVQVFKPIIDNRGEGLNKVRGKAGSEFPATPVHKAEEILAKMEPNVDVVGIDEAQFLNSKIIGVVRELSRLQKKVVVAGLPADFRGEPFGSMPELMAISHTLMRCLAVCTFIEVDGEMCRADATQTQRIVNGKPAKYGDPIVLVGAEEAYEARCRKHHFVPR